MAEHGGSSGWQLAEDSAEAYEEFLVPFTLEGWARRLVDHANLAPGERVLDAGCGTGIVARTAASVVGPEGSVTGVDLNGDMIAVAQRASEGTRPAIDFRQGDAADLDVPSGSFDVVLAQELLQFVPDREAVVGEMHRVLDRDGRLAMSVLRSLDHNRPYAALAAVLDRHLGPEAGDGIRSPFPDLSVDDLRSLLERNGFQDVHVTIAVSSGRYPSPAEMLRREAAASPLAEPVGALEDGEREGLVEDLAQALEPFVDDDGVVVPFATYLATAEPSAGNG